MQVAVITRHAISNYGSLLQAMATQQIIEGLGHSCEIIDYIREDENYLEYEKNLLKRKPEWSNNIFKRVVYLAVRQPGSILVGKKFEKAQQRYLHLSKRYGCSKELVKDKPTADVYITGSDQVWGPVGNGVYDSSYCLSFTQEEDKRIAYAASFGHNEMNPELNLYYKKWLSRYTHIAVREDCAVRMLTELGIGATQVLDPTLLLNSDEWSKYVDDAPRRKYVLVYQLHNDKNVGVYAKKVAKAKGLPLIRISASLHQIHREGKFVYAPSIGEFLSYIKNAECMITDSFHGTAFAINFNTPFVEILPNNNTGSRNQSILKVTGLTGQILTDVNDITLASRTIDFSFANSTLVEERKKSIALLKRMIES